MTLTQRMDLRGPDHIEPVARTMLCPLLQDEADGVFVVGTTTSLSRAAP